MKKKRQGKKTSVATEESEAKSGAIGSHNDDEADKDAKRRKLIARRKLKITKIRTDKSNLDQSLQI